MIDLFDPDAVERPEHAVQGTLLDDALALTLPPFSHGDGILYVLASVDRSLAKVGMTIMASPLKRAAHYGREHGIVWNVFWFAETQLVARVETDIHRALRPHQHLVATGAREIFKVTPEEARDLAMRYIRPRKAEDQLRSEAIDCIIQQHDSERLDKTRERLRHGQQRSERFGGHGQWRRGGRHYEPWRQDAYVRARIKVSDQALAGERQAAEATVAAMSEAELRTAAAEDELYRRRQRRIDAGRERANSTREETQEALAARMAAADRAEAAELEAVAALWSARADHWREQAAVEHAALAAYKGRGRFDRLMRWADGRSPVQGHREQATFLAKAVHADREASRVRAMAPTAGQILPEMERIDRMLERACAKGELIDPIWPKRLEIPAPPPAR